MQLQKDEYKQFIVAIKSKIQSSQIKASIQVNVELLKLYWDIAEMIVQKQKESSWGDGFIKNISQDLKVDFPNMKGFSVSNIKYMRQWYLFFSKSQQLVDQLEHTKSLQLVDEIFQIPWGHNITIITKVKDIEVAKFYLKKTIEGKI